MSRKSPRGNRPRATSAKRGESNFGWAYGRVYRKRFRQASSQNSFLPAREVQVIGFGVADFVWFAWRPTSRSQAGSAIEYHSRPRFSHESLLAFALKLRAWKQALGQAYRHRYFADSACAVLPPATPTIAKRHWDDFRKPGAGPWSFDKHTQVIRRFHPPRRRTPLSSKARERAIATLTRLVRAS